MISTEVTHITVVGSGVMGRGIAYVSAVAGYNTVLQDIAVEQLERAYAEIEATVTKAVTRNLLTQEEATSALARLTTTTDLPKAVAKADLVIEAVIEEIGVKIDVFRTADAFAPAHAIFATNTSTMSPTEIGASTGRPEKTIAMHFFNPVHKMKLIEIVRGLDTSDQCFQTICDVARQMGKETIEVHEFPGFVTSRINCVIGNEAMKMVQEGVASPADIDKALRLGLNHPMGPLEMVDLVGLDARLRNMQYLHEKLGEVYRPAPILEKYVKAGRLGRKSGQGFYTYPQ
ncbi:putative 3-hydroxybutyryl-CoA dehydrogenase [Acidibacillus sp. S0AB]|uniref:3-hydroxybutyryl-CoA dehydrogenase n=2 Tax=Sulfoacidibacillus ferrooxidans TaxID=2005001 RepID=A0A9X1V6Z5_9BACL|nr:putative 3-hydroxybutyryl-CoA dehydrogenase [Sulfoacidibacillus ferrooxidans]